MIMSGKTKRYYKCCPENSELNFDNKKQAIFDGILLGDGSISKDSKLFSVSQKRDRKDYLYFICEKLDFESNRVFDKPEKVDNRTDKTYKGSFLRTTSDYYFHTQRDRWYVDGVKIIPKDLVMSQELLLHLFLCDGTAFISSRGDYNIKLATNCFNDDDLIYFIGLLKSVNINAYKSCGVIYINKESHNKFFDYIGDCPIECFKYKWVNNNKNK